MKSNVLKSLLVAGVLVGISGTTLASPFIATFSIAGFDSTSPVQSVVGSIRYEANSLNAPIDHLTGIDLTVNGHSYTLQEVDFVTSYSPPNVMPWNTTTIGGRLNGVGAISHETTDFWLRWHTDTHAWEDFYYASVGLYGIRGVSHWDPSASVQFNIAAAPVPEPMTWALLLTGLSLLGGVSSRRKSPKAGK